MVLTILVIAMRNIMKRIVKRIVLANDFLSAIFFKEAQVYVQLRANIVIQHTHPIEIIIILLYLLILS